MQGKLIGLVLAQANTQPQQKKLSEDELATVGGIIGVLFLLVIIAMTIGTRRSKNKEDQERLAEELALAKQFQQEYSQESSTIVQGAVDVLAASVEKMEDGRWKKVTGN